tara:strand:+ start:761 stop:3061 length:2301 start_codon:yes stop_codon:yes gene_type:complete
MGLQNLKFRPGIVRETTSYSNEGGWFDGDLVRFRFGLPEKIGGWEKVTSNTFQGSCRSLHNWIAFDGSDYLGVGTNLKFYIESGLQFNDITPIRKASSLTAAALATVNTETTVTVTDPSHGALQDDFVTFSGLSAVNGIPAGNLNIEHQITSITDSNIYVITVASAATSTGAGSGGDAFTATYQVNTGPNSAAGGTGWGAGLWGGIVDGATSTTLNGAISSPTSTSNITLTSATGFSSASTTLSSAVIVGDSSISLASVTGLPSQGSVKINSEVIKYGTITGSNLTDLTRGAFGTTEAGHASSDAVAYLGVVLIDDELITYTGISTNDLTGITRATRGTSGATHSDGASVQDARTFIGWGDAAATSVTNELRLWSQDNYGEDLLFNVRDGSIFLWKKADGLTSRGVSLATETGAIDCPTICRQVMSSDRDGHVIAFGCNPVGSSIQDPLLIRWSNFETNLDWEITESGTAGDLSLGSGSEFVRAAETKREVIVWTDTSLHSLTFLGPPDTFGLAQISNNITIVAPNAVAAVDDVMFWMGRDTFYSYDGRVQTLPCAVRQKVFGDINSDRLRTIYAGVNSEFTEIIWFYPSASATENDSYVVYNYGEKVWYYGNMSRTAWIDRGIRNFPQATGTLTYPYLYNHEFGTDDDGSPITSYVESSPFDLGEGEHFGFIDKVIPDLTFDGSTVDSPVVDFTMQARNFPGANYNVSQTGSATRTSTTPVEQFTNQIFVRVRGRSMSLKVSSNTAGVQWRLGTPRVNVKQDGRR